MNSAPYTKFIEALEVFNKTIKTIEDEYPNQLEVHVIVPSSSVMRYVDGDTACTDNRYLLREIAMVGYTAFESA
jgi:hypothetical protein